MEELKHLIAKEMVKGKILHADISVRRAYMTNEKHENVNTYSYSFLERLIQEYLDTHSDEITDFVMEKLGGGE